MFMHPDALAWLAAQHQAELLNEAEEFRRIKQARTQRRRTSDRSHLGGRPLDAGGTGTAAVTVSWDLGGDCKDADPGIRQRALLRWRIHWRVKPEGRFGSDRPGEEGERSRDPLGGRCVDTEFVVPAPQILDERVPADNHLRGPIGAQPAHGS